MRQVKIISQAAVSWFGYVPESNGFIYIIWWILNYYFAYRYILNICFSLLECNFYHKDLMHVIKLVWNGWQKCILEVLHKKYSK